MSLVQAQGTEAACVPRIATGFVAGAAGHGELCGALVGAVMALGLKFGRDRSDDLDARAATSEKVHRLLSAFADRFGSVRCIDLTGCDLLTSEGKALAQEKDQYGKVCPKYVGFVAGEALRLLTASE